MRVAQLFDDTDDQGGFRFSPDRERIADGAQQDLVAAFLRAGQVVLYTTATEPDRIDPARGSVVGLSYRTDGVWAWSDGLEYYVRAYGIAPDPDFYAHIRACGYRCAAPAAASVQEALIAIVGRGVAG